MPNQNPEQLARDRIDFLLTGTGRIIQAKRKINLSASMSVVFREYQPNHGPTAYNPLVKGQPAGVIEAMYPRKAITSK